MTLMQNPDDEIVREAALDRPTDAPSPSDASPRAVRLELRGISVFYGKTLAVADVNLPILDRHVTAIIGPSGSGKTSLLHTINRLHELIPGCRVSGQVLLDGQDITSPSIDLQQLRRRIGMIFQRPTPFPISIWKNIELPLREAGHRNRAEIADRIESSLKDVGLWDDVHDRLHRSALNLSGGQQQRLCLARTLVLDPEVLLLDEPCSALDPPATAGIEQLLLRCRQRCAVVIVTHNLAQAKRLADSVAVLWKRDNTGRLIEHAEADRLFANPTQSETADYIFGRSG